MEFKILISINFSLSFINWQLIQLLEKFWVILEQVGYFQLNFIKSKYRSKKLLSELRYGLEVKYTPDFQDMVQ